MSYFIKNDFLKIYQTLNDWFKNHELAPKVITVANADLLQEISKHNGSILVNIYNLSASSNQFLHEATFNIQILTQKTKIIETNIVDKNSKELQDLLTIYSLLDDLSVQFRLQDFEVNLTTDNEYRRVSDPDWEVIECEMSFSIMNQGRH